MDWTPETIALMINQINTPPMATTGIMNGEAKNIRIPLAGRSAKRGALEISDDTEKWLVDLHFQFRRAPVNIGKNRWILTRNLL